MVLLSTIIMGIAALVNVPVELSPEIEYPRLSVSARWHGTSPEAVEAHLTAPLEAVLSTTEGLKKISSRSSEGSCYIDMEFHSSTDMDFARLEINEKLSSIKDDLPYGVTPPAISQYIPSDFRDLQGFLTYTVSANVSADEIRKYLTDHFQNQILSIDGISDVQVTGGNERLISIVIDYEKSKALGITNEEMNKAAQEAEKILSAGKVNRSSNQLSISIFNAVTGTELLENLVVKKLQNENAIRFRDIGTIFNSYQQPRSYFRIDGKETVTIEINKEPGANTISTADKVFSRIEELQKGFPPGYLIKKEIDKSESIREELNELYSNAAYSFAMIILVLLVLFRNLKYSMIVLLSIVFSILLSILLFYIFEISINILTLSSITLGFGLIVDNSIVVLDYLDKKYNGQGIRRLAVLVKEIFFPVFASTLTTIAVFIPLIFLTGELRLYFEQFALATIFTMICSLFVAFTIIPLAYIKLAYNPKAVMKKEKKNYTQRIYTALLGQMIKWKKLSFTVLILIIGLPVWLIPSRIETPVIGEVYNSVFDSETYSEIKKYVHYSLGGSLNLFFNHISKGEMWKYNEPTYLFVRLELPNGNHIERINELTKDFEKQIIEYKRNYKILTARIINEETAVLRVDFSDAQSNTSFPYMLKNYLTAYAVQLGGLTVSVAGFGPGFYNGLGGSSFNFNIKAAGFNYERVKSLAEEFRVIVSKNPRVDNVDIDKSMFGPNDDTYEIAAVIDREKLARNNIEVNELLENIAKNTEGNLTWNRFRIGNEEVNFEIKFSNYRNLQLDDLENTIIQNPERDHAKLKDMVTFSERKTLSVINREDRQYVRYIAFDYKGPFQYGEKFAKSAVASMKVPEGYKVELKSFMFLMRDEEETDIWKTLLISILLIFMISASLFESFKKPFLVLFAIPFAFIGTIFLFYFGEYSLDRGAYAGLLLLVGLSVNNSIILIDYISKNLKHNGNKDIFLLSYNRLRPVFTTTITTVAALLPLLLSEADGFWKSLAQSITGGIALSAIIVVIYVPIIYTLMKKSTRLSAIQTD